MIGGLVEYREGGGRGWSIVREGGVSVVRVVGGGWLVW